MASLVRLDEQRSGSSAPVPGASTQTAFTADLAKVRVTQETEREPTMPTVSTILGSLYVDDQGEPDEPTALLWPSLFTDHRMWRHQIAPLREAGWRTLALDPPGHGRSPGPGRGFTMDECAQAAVQVLDATDVRAPAVVFGTSWGGFVAPRIAMLAPERLSGMALFNTSAERGTPFERIRATLLTKLLAIGPLDKMTARMIVSGLLTPETQRREPQLGAELAEQFLTWDRRRFIATVRSVLVDRDPVLDALPRLKVPALIVSGKEDHTLPSFHSQRMAQKLPNARHIEVSGAAHLVPLEAPDEANRLILDFLRDLPGQSELQPGAVLYQRPERGAAPTYPAARSRRFIRTTDEQSRRSRPPTSASTPDGPLTSPPSSTSNR